MFQSGAFNVSLKILLDIVMGTFYEDKKHVFIA
jgi:hypothetical protein